MKINLHLKRSYGGHPETFKIPRDASTSGKGRQRGVRVLVWIRSRDMGVKEAYSDGHVDIAGCSLKFRFATKFPSKEKIFKSSGYRKDFKQLLDTKGKFKLEK